MSERVHEFVARAPRLHLGPEDTRDMYFALDSEHGIKHQTEIRDLSVTGMSFVTEQPQAPTIGELIKVEFTLPEIGKVAWFAKVMRIEAYYDSRWLDPEDPFETPPKVLVGVKYADLPEEHKSRIHNSLEKRFAELRSQRIRSSFFGLFQWAGQNAGNLALFALSIIACYMAFKWLSLNQPLISQDTGSVFYHLFKGWDWSLLNFF